MAKNIRIALKNSSIVPLDEWFYRLANKFIDYNDLDYK